MNVLEKKALIRRVINVKNYCSARDIFLTLCILFPKESEQFKSSSEIGQLIIQMVDIKFVRNGKTSPKLYFI